MKFVPLVLAFASAMAFAVPAKIESFSLICTTNRGFVPFKDTWVETDWGQVTPRFDATAKTMSPIGWFHVLNIDFYNDEIMLNGFLFDGDKGQRPGFTKINRMTGNLMMIVSEKPNDVNSPARLVMSGTCRPAKKFSDEVH